MPDGGYRIPEILNPDDSIYVCVPVPDEPGHRQAFAGALYSLACWWNWEEEETQSGTIVAALWFEIWRDVVNQIDQKLASCAGGLGEVCPDAGQCVYSGGNGWCGFFADGCDFGRYEKMSIIKIGGIAYLVNNCGCADAELYQLSRASVTVDEETGDAKIAKLDIAGIKAGKDLDFPPVSASFQSCYAEKAVSYLMARVVEYMATADEIMLTGLDFLAGGLDEWLDVAAVAIDLLGGESVGLLSLVRGYTLADIEDALTATDFVDHMEATWTFDGAINRVQLFNWVMTAPFISDEIPVQNLMVQWLSSSIIAGYNEQLRMFATECETGQTLADIVESYYEEVEYNGNTYPTWTYQPDLLNPAPGVFQPDVPDLQAIAGVWTITGTSGTVSVRLFKKDRSWLANSQGIGEHECVVTANVDAGIAAEMVAGRSFTTQGGAGTFSYPSFQRQDSTGDADVTLDLVVCVGAAL
ncbi:MAG: hypothetical protein KAR40_14340 [Candidatus Sabulitectum sp.]|nr:hypothetical protein [Candidatus Sabulitectum sp.]